MGRFSIRRVRDGGGWGSFICGAWSVEFGVCGYGGDLLLAFFQTVFYIHTVLSCQTTIPIPTLFLFQQLFPFSASLSPR